MTPSRSEDSRLAREDAVEQVRAATDIADLIGSYVALRQAGRNLKGLCPFHREKTPSFIVSRERQLFHCFGCGAGGDAFTFVMKHDGLSFPEALELLARRAGIPLPERRAIEGPDRSALIEAMREAVRFYRGRLRAQEGGEARQYLQRRGFTGKILDLYYCGYAPAGGRAWLEHASARFSRDVLIQAGLIAESQDGRLYDRFRGRVVLPILTLGGDPIGFGGRAIQKDVEPKYLNSPETAIYKKSQVLFGLPQARHAIRTEGFACVVEGYFDAISLSSASYANVVAPCGTAWTAEHARLLLRQTQRIVLLFDGDSAGEAAAWRALAVTLPVHSDLSVAVLPEGKDPDDLVREGATDLLREKIAAPLSPVAFALESLTRQGHSGHMLLERVAELLAGVGSDLARETMVDEAAEHSRVPAAVMRREVQRIRQTRRRFERGPETAGRPGAGAPHDRLLPLEETILRLAHARPTSVVPLREFSAGVPAVSGGVQSVLAWLEERARESRPVHTPELLRRLRSEIAEELDGSFLVADDLPELDESYEQDLLGFLRRLALDADLAALGYEIRSVESGIRSGEGAADRCRLAELLARKQELARERAQLGETRPAAAG